MKLLLASLVLLLLTLTTPGCGDDASSLQFSPDKLPAARVGQPYAVTVTVSRNKTPVGDMTVADGRLPRGLTFHQPRGSGTAEIRGVPKEAGTFEFAVAAWCLGTNTTGQSGRQTYELVVE